MVIVPTLRKSALNHCHLDKYQGNNVRLKGDSQRGVSSEPEVTLIALQLALGSLWSLDCNFSDGLTCIILLHKIPWVRVTDKSQQFVAAQTHLQKKQECPLLRQIQWLHFKVGINIVIFKLSRRKQNVLKKIQVAFSENRVECSL